MKLYHITSISLIEAILNEGLRGNEEGEIFLFEDMQFTINDITNTVSDHIAANQVFLDKYYMFKVDSKGFKSEPVQDDVGEITSRFQWILKQECIEPEYISPLGLVEANYKPFYKFN